MPYDRFDPLSDKFHIFREIIVTMEEYEILKNRINRTEFEDQLLACCREVRGCIDVEVIKTDVKYSMIIPKSEFDEGLN